LISDKLSRPRIIVGHCGHCEEGDEFYSDNIEEKTLKNTNFREVLSTNKHSQLVVMSVEPNEELGSEVHEDIDQFFRIEKGHATFVLGDDEEEVEAKDGDAVIVPAGTRHNIINASDSDDLKMYTIYSPPKHPAGTIYKTKKDAEAEPED
jgi:mannose-6-phosphate isomerase-like protein (cupin superfamily)